MRSLDFLPRSTRLSLKKKSIRDVIALWANSPEDLSVDGSKLASQIVTLLSLTAIFTSQYLQVYLFQLGSKNSPRGYDNVW